MNHIGTRNASLREPEDEVLYMTGWIIIIIIIIIIITRKMFKVLSSWHSRCESSPGSFDEGRLNAGWLPTLRPNQTIWAVSSPIRCYHPQTPSPFIIITQLIITQLISWYSFYRPTEGGMLRRSRHCSKGAQPVPKAVYGSDCRDKHDRPRWDSNLGPVTPQSGVLPLSHRDRRLVWLHHFWSEIKKCVLSYIGITKRK